MHKISRLKSYIWILFLASLIILIGLINLSRTYRSQVDVLIVPKNETTSKNISSILNNAKEIPKTLSFYNEIISLNDSVADESEELPEYKRKAYWESKVKTERIDDSSIIRLTIFDKDQSRAFNLSQEAGLEEARVMSRYYNIKTDIDVRISDGPIVNYGIKENVIFLILKSLLAGIIFGFLVALINLILEKIGIGSKKSSKKAGLHKLKFPEMKKEETKTIAFDKKPADFKKTTAIPILEKKASAPENLPISDQLVSEFLEKKPEGQPIIREATPEEVKERLNKLLRGEL
jgi:capsular polysaccharide biosynthesis protein